MYIFITKSTSTLVILLKLMGAETKSFIEDKIIHFQELVHLKNSLSSKLIFHKIVFRINFNKQTKTSAQHNHAKTNK